MQRDGDKPDNRLQDIPSPRPPNDGQLYSQTFSESKKEADTSLQLPPFSQIDQSVLELLPPDIVSEIIDANKALEELKNRDYLERKTALAITSRMQRPDGGQSHRTTKRGKSKPKNSFLELPPQSQLDRSVLESLPEDILAEISHAYGQELQQKSLKNQFSSPPTSLPLVTLGDAVSPTGEAPISDCAEVNNRHGYRLKQPENISSMTMAITDDALDCGQPTAAKKTVYDGYDTMLQNITRSIDSGPSCWSLSCSLLSVGSSIPIHDERDLSVLQPVIMKCCLLLTDHIRAIASHDLEEVYLILCSLKRLGRNCKLWRAVQEFTIPSAKDIVCELHGGKLNFD